MTKRTIILPIRDNNGQSLSTEIARIEDELLTLAPGFTTNVSAGVWRSDSGILYRDQHVTYIVVSDPTTDAKLAQRLDQWARWLRQEALYTDSTMVDVELAGATQRLD